MNSRVSALARFHDRHIRLFLPAALLASSACSSGGGGAGAGDPLAPQAPLDLRLVSVTPDSATVAWTDSADDEDGFWLERALDSAGSPAAFSILAQLEADAELHHDAGLTAGTTYWYRVRSFRGSAASGYSALLRATTPTEGAAPQSRSDVLALADDQYRPRLLVEDDGRYFVSMSSGGRAVLLAFAPDHGLLWQRELGDFPPLTDLELRRAPSGDLWLIQPLFGFVCRLRGSDGSVVWSRDYDATLRLDAPSPHSPPLASLPVFPFAYGFLGVISGDGRVAWSHESEAILVQQLLLPDGGLLARGLLADLAPLLARFDGDGEEAWERLLVEQGPSFTARITGLRQGIDGELHAFGSLGDDFWMGTFDAAGNVVSQRTLALPGSAGSGAALELEDPSGGHFLIAADNSGRPYLFRFDALGNFEWTLRVNSPGVESVQQMLLRPSGGVYLVGSTDFAGGGVWIVALSAEGVLDWERVLVDTQDGAVALGSALGTEEGGLMLSGSSTLSVWSVRLGAQGELLEQHTWTEFISTSPARLDLLPEGRRALSWGALIPASTSAELMTALFDTTGELLHSVRVPFAGIDFDPNVNERIQVGRSSPGRVLYVFPSEDASGRDVARTEVSDAAAAGDGVLASGCVASIAAVGDRWMSIDGISVVDDPTTDVTATRWAQTLEADYIHPATVDWEELDLSVFQGTTSPVVRCAD